MFIGICGLIFSVILMVWLYNFIKNDSVIADKDAEIATLEAQVENLKDKCQMHDFFWEGCGFDKMGFKNSIGVRDYCDKLKAENERLKAAPEEIMKEVFGKALIYPHDMVRLQDAYLLAVSLRDAKRALWLARAWRAKEHVWHEVSSDGKPMDDYKGQDWVLVQLRDDTGHELIPRIAEYRRNVQRWVFIDEDYDTVGSHTMQYLRERCRVIGWRVIDPSYRGRKFYVQNEMDKKVERLCRTKAEGYK